VPLLATGPVAAAAPTTAELDAAEARVEQLINQKRAARDKRLFRADGRVATVARRKSQDMVDRHYFDHADRQGHYADFHLRRAGVRFSRVGEIIAWGRGSDLLASADEAVDIWMHSAVHRRQILTNNNYFGAGLAIEGSTWKWTVIFVTSPDHTAPRARFTSATAEATDIRVRWTGYDPLLVVGTTGLRGYDLQRREPEGAWTLIRRLTTMTSYSASAAPGLTYEYRVRARDRAGNVGLWTTPVTVTTS
jgi:hypothetical protein